MSHVTLCGSESVEADSQLQVRLNLVEWLDPARHQNPACQRCIESLGFSYYRLATTILSLLSRDMFPCHSDMYTFLIKA